MIVTLGQQYNVGEKPTVILYTYIVVDSHVKRFVPVTGETTVTQQVSHRLSNVNPARGDNPLQRPAGIQIATKSYATLQAMAASIKYNVWFFPIFTRC